MQGYSRFQDFYVCVPTEGVWTRAANAHRYGPFKNEIFIDGKFIGATRMDRIKGVKELYNAGCIDEARQYIRKQILNDWHNIDFRQYVLL